MWLLPVALALGMVAGFATGGRLASLRGARVHAWPLLLAGTAASIMPSMVDVAQPALWLAVGPSLVLAGVLLNLQFVGATVVVAGLVLAVVPVHLNRAVTVDAGAARAVGWLGTSAEGGRVDLPPGYRIEDGDDVLTGLGAVAPVDALGTVLSFGQLIAIAGLADVGFHVTRRRATRRVEARHRARHHHPVLGPRLATAGGPAYARGSSVLGPIDLTDKGRATDASEHVRGTR